MRLPISAKSVSSGWAMSAVKQTTATPFSVSHFVMVHESSPPDAATATVLPFRSSTVVDTGPLRFFGWSGCCLGIIYEHPPDPHTDSPRSLDVDEWDALGPGMKIDRRATDWGLVSLWIGGCFLVMAPIMFTVYPLYLTPGGRLHPTAEMH